MRAVVLAAAIQLGACGGTGAVSTPSPSTSSLAACSLPVVTSTKNGVGYASQRGFIAVPSGAFSVDSSATGTTYDWVYRRWLPVLASDVLPDGSAYAYEQEMPDGPYEIHMVQVATGADKVVLHMPYDNAYSIVALQPEGIYLVPILHRSGMPTGLWLFSSPRATLTAVAGAADLSWNVIEAGAAWGGPAGGDTLFRLDLTSGVVTPWFQHAIAPALGIGSNFGPSVVGFDRAGGPLVAFYPRVDAAVSPAPQPTPEVWLVSSPTQSKKLIGMPLPGVLRVGATDTHGTWLVGSDGFYLYTDAGFCRAAPMPPGPVGDFQISGTCS